MKEEKYFVWFCEECGGSWETKNFVDYNFDCKTCFRTWIYCEKCMPESNKCLICNRESRALCTHKK